jgi:hypothetical protein
MWLCRTKKEKKDNIRFVERKKKRKITSGYEPQREARYQDELVDWLSAARRTPTPTPTACKRKSQGERKIGRGSQMGAWHHDGLADWLSVVMWLRLRQTRPLVRECAPQRQHSNFETKNYLWSQVPEWTWHQDILSDRHRNMTLTCTVNYRPVLSSERALQNYKPATVWRKFQGESKVGRGSQMGAWLADWLSVAMWLRLNAWNPMPGGITGPPSSWRI